MENKPFFSIIVPIFNAEKYLKECIDSVIEQSFSSWELILVDDGSKDTSGQICDDYSLFDNRIKVIHKENGGEFSARFTAIQIACGEYLTGLDADDIYSSDYLRTIYDIAIIGNYDCIKWSLTCFGDSNSQFNLPKRYVKEYYDNEFLEFALRNTYHSFCTQAIKLELIKKINYSEIPKVKISEDYLMTIPALCYVKKAFVKDYYGYLYRIHSNNASKVVSFKILDDLFNVSQYGLKMMKLAGVLDKKVIKAEYCGFLKCIWPRIQNSLKFNVISNEEIKYIRNHKIYRASRIQEKINIFGWKNWVKMKLFRFGKITLLKRFL